ncbi:response regulator transcription factor [Anaerobacillus sp. 1_MG-2023]|uniref:response regulator transcription factor n=1 Tax=Anaerobacillus sp. 1_MG-2023 TaxID=3062655 RepID=UPI0026E3FFBC|nr:response regulator transcription factor [Anaerobacillus sp. 1_MG-2023]MDO6657988.1 response regulator transcription factor [Anaerobacillus sp. 1_MG-2023]
MKSIFRLRGEKGTELREMQHVFVIDDEQNIRDILEKYLKKEGFIVSTFTDGAEVLSALETIEPDLLVLDIMMPNVDGLELLRRLRKHSYIPVIVVSARDEELDRILGLELGADDYLTKPFSPRELVVRIKNLFKRMNRLEKNHSSQEITVQNVRLNKKKRLLLVNEEEMALTPKEYDVLAYLLQHPEQPFTRERLIEAIWGYQYVGDGRIIDDLVKRLRKKMSDAKAQAKITTVWGYGYKIDEEV